MTPKKQPSRRPAFTDAEARGFERQLMPERFRKHAGEPVDEVPIDYLLFCIDNPDQFVAELGWYLASERGQARMEAEIP